MPGADRLFSLTSKWVNKDAADNLSPHVRCLFTLLGLVRVDVHEPQRNIRFH